MFNQLIKVINSLPSKTKFAITQDWLIANGINATPNDAKSLGSQFASSYIKYGCEKLGRGSDNHNLYEKK